MRPADPPLDRSKPCSGRTQLTTEERPEPPAYNVLKTWASDDWGLYGRGEELLSRALARNPRVGRVFHVQPPVDPAEMRQRFRDPRWEQDIEGQLRRFQGVEDGGVLLFTPAARRDQPEAALDRTVEFLERRQAFGRPLVMLQSLVHPFGNDLARRLGGRGVTRVALVRRDARAGYPPDADERKAIQDIYKNEIPGVELVWAGTRELVDEFKALNPRTVLQPIGADQGLAKGKPALELADLPRPVIIYAGSMRAYLNIGLIKGTAERLTDASFVFVGPAAEFLAPLVSGSRNVHVIGPRPYELLPDYLAAEELRRLVWIARDPSEFSRAIQGALKRDRDRRRSLRQAAVAPLSWDAIGDHLVQSVDAVRAGGDLPGPPELRIPAIPGFLAR